MLETIKQRLAAWRGNASESSSDFKYAKPIGLLLAVYLLVVLLVGWYWSWEPDFIDVEHMADRSGASATAPVVGTTLTGTLIAVTETLLDKSGGFISNDIFPPGLWMDNMPNWEYGVLIQSRDLTRALRESFSRSQSQSKEDIDLSKAEPRLNFSNHSWLVPASESQYRDAIEFLQSYQQRLLDQDNSNAQFYARADNLRYWLSIVESRLGSLSQRLSASVGKRQLAREVSDTAVQQRSATRGDMMLKTPRTELDDVFYEARGTAWALIHFLKAVEIDFADVLQNKNALVSVQQIIRELESTQESIFSPMILNGDGFGLLANHSLVMASYISRANAAIIDLRDLLAQG